MKESHFPSATKSNRNNGLISESTTNFKGLDKLLAKFSPSKVIDIAFNPNTGEVKVYALESKILTAAITSKQVLNITRPALKGYCYINAMTVGFGGTKAIAVELSDTGALKTPVFKTVATSLIKWLRSDLETKLGITGKKGAKLEGVNEVIFAHSIDSKTFFCRGLNPDHLEAITEINGEKTRAIRMRAWEGRLDIIAVTEKGINYNFYPPNNRAKASPWTKVFTADYPVISASKLGDAGILVLNYENGFETVPVSGLSPKNVDKATSIGFEKNPAFTGVLALVADTHNNGGGRFAVQVYRGKAAPETLLVPAHQMPKLMQDAAEMEFAARNRRVQPYAN